MATPAQKNTALTLPRGQAPVCASRHSAAIIESNPMNVSNERNDSPALLAATPATSACPCTDCSCVECKCTGGSCACKAC